jgi:hypothetical protein
MAAAHLHPLQVAARPGQLSGSKRQVLREEERLPALLDSCKDPGLCFEHTGI